MVIELHGKGLSRAYGIGTGKVVMCGCTAMQEQHAHGCKINLAPLPPTDEMHFSKEDISSPLRVLPYFAVSEWMNKEIRKSARSLLSFLAFTLFQF
jgi:glutamate synthase domain-containing protein 2